MQVENARRGSYITGGGGAAVDVVGARRSCPCRPALPPLALPPSPPPVDEDASGGGAASCEQAWEPGGCVRWRRGEGDNGARWMRSRADESRERSFLFKSREQGLRLNHSSGFVLALSF